MGTGSQDGNPAESSWSWVRSQVSLSFELQHHISVAMWRIGTLGSISLNPYRTTREVSRDGVSLQCRLVLLMLLNHGSWQLEHLHG